MLLNGENGSERWCDDEDVVDIDSDGEGRDVGVLEDAGKDAGEFVRNRSENGGGLRRAEG
jgi:hypothetical protein